MNQSYKINLNILKALDDKIMSKLKNAQSLYPQATRSGIALGAIKKGLPLLTKKALVLHRREKGNEYANLSLHVPESLGVNDFATKLDTNITTVLYNALIRGIEHG